MKLVEFKNAYYIKLGSKGKWEETSIQENKMRIGWTQTSLSDINDGNWTKIQRELARQSKTKGAATRDYDALRRVTESTSDDVWVTFHASKLWWCKPGEGKIFEDAVSKYRKVAGKWSCTDSDHAPLIATQIPGSLSKLQGFRGTVCRVKEVDTLHRLLNSQHSEAFEAITNASESLAAEVEQGLKLLHWKDFETLVDLIFRGAGWRRVSMAGETMKYADLELEEPMTGDVYQVQVKSTASRLDYEKYAQQFSSPFKKFYFVVHTPQNDLSQKLVAKNKAVELMLPKQIAQKVVEFGLVNWLLKKIK